jgi:hypothetical protein
VTGFLRTGTIRILLQSRRNYSSLTSWRFVKRGKAYHLGMSRICPEYLGAETTHHSVAADVLGRDEPDEEEDEEDQEDNDNDEDHSDEGYSE